MSGSVMTSAASLVTERSHRVRDIAYEMLRLFSAQARVTTGLSSKGQDVPSKLRDSLQTLGVTFVKLGQTLSTRHDLLPEPYIAALSELKSDVEPMSFDVVRQVIEDAYGQPLETVFDHFDPEPLGSASIGQVHVARLYDGREVAVKVQRPGARTQVDHDLALLRGFARSLEGVGVDARIKLSEIVENFATTTRLELDYRVEARNLMQVREALRSHPHIVVPRAHIDLTNRTVLVMERAHGTPLSRIQERPDNGTELAEAVCEAYFTQMFEEGFFHADPHPGNLLLGDDGRVVLLDLGMVELLDQRDRTTIAQLVVSLSNGSAEVVSEALRHLCERTSSADDAAMERQVRRLVREDMALRGVEPTFGSTTHKLIRAMLDHGFQPAPQLASLARTLAMLDEVLLVLDPRFDPALILERRAGELAVDQAWHGLFGAHSAEQGLELTRMAHRGPRRLVQLLERLATGEFTINVDAFDETATLRSLTKIANRIAAAVIVAALLLAGAMLDGTGSAVVAGLSIHSVVLLAMGSLGALFLLASVFIFDR